jgi:hypothetical protein
LLTDPEADGINFCRRKLTVGAGLAARTDMRVFEMVLRATLDASSASGDFFIFFGCNPLKSPDSAKGIQGNASLFAWISLDFLAVNSRAG